MRRRGFALLIVLWTLVPVSVLLLTLAGVARSNSHHRKTLPPLLLLPLRRIFSSFAPPMSRLASSLESWPWESRSATQATRV